MKKFLLLLSLALFCMGGAWAQETYFPDTQDHDDVVTDVSQLSNFKVYSIIPEDWYHEVQDGDDFRANGLYGVLFARETSDRILSAGGWGNCVDNQDPRKPLYAGWQSADKATQKDSYDPRQQFAIIQYEDNYYLWSVAAKKFAVIHDMSHLGYSSCYAELSTSKVSPITMTRCADLDRYDNRFLILFKNEDNSNLKLVFTYAWHTNAAWQTNVHLVSDMSEGDLSALEICGRGEFDPTEAIEVLDNIFHPAATIVYIVKDSEGQVIFTSDPIPVMTGLTINDLPDKMKDDFYTYTCEEPIVTEKGENFVTLVKGNRVYPVQYLEYSAPEERTTGTGASATNPARTYTLEEPTYYFMTVGGKFVYVDEDNKVQYSDVLDNTDAYQWCFMEAPDKGEGCFRIFSKQLGGSFSFNYQGSSAAVLALRKNVDNAYLLTPQGTPYGVGFALSKSTDNDNYLQISEEIEGAIQFTEGEGEEAQRKYPTDVHAVRVYEATEELAEVNIQFNVRTSDGVTVASEVYPVPLGSLVEELPDELLRDYSDYEYQEPFVAVPEGDNIFKATVTFTLPFEEGKPYRLLVDGKYVKANKETGIAEIDPEATEDDTYDPVYFWGFRGNPYGGIEVMNRGIGRAFANNTAVEEDIPLPLGDAEWWDVFDNGAGMAFGKSEKFVANIDGTLVLTSDEDAMWDEASGFDITEVETAEVRFVLNDEAGNEILTKTEDGHYVNVAVSDIPASMKRPFCDYSTEPVVVQEEGTVVTSVVTYVTPFTTDGADYFLRIDGAMLGYVNNALLAKATPTEADRKDKAFYWTFTGTPYEGYTVKNTLSGKYLSGNTRTKTRVEMKDESAKFTIAEEGAGFTFMGINGEYICREGNVAYLAVTPESDASKLLTTEKVPTYIDVTYIVEEENGSTVFTSTDKVVAGTVITDLPAEAKRDFCTYTENSITVEEGAENVYRVTVSYNLPFTTSDFDSGNMEWYLLNTGNGEAFAAYLDEYDDEYYVRTEEADAASQAQQWAFKGSPYKGFKLYNRERAQYLLADDSSDNYGIFADEGTAWTISGTADAMQLSSNGKNFYYFEDYGFCMLGDGTTPFSVEFVPQIATVIYNIVDENNEVVYTETDENAQIGHVINELPATAKRDFCSYEFDPLTVVSGENILNAKVTYDLPFDMNTYNYITVGDTAAVYGAYSEAAGYGFAGFEDVRPVSGEFNIKDITTWYKWPYTLEEQVMIHDMYGDKYDSQYGYSAALPTENLWRIDGNPYSGYTLVISQPDDEGNPQYLTDDDGYTGIEPVYWQLSEVENGYALNVGENYLSAYYVTYQGVQYGYIGSDSEPTAFNFFAWDLAAYNQLAQDYENAQAELNAYITDIKSVTTNRDDDKRIYDLQGRRMNKLGKGVNIVNGKKVLVK